MSISAKKYPSQTEYTVCYRDMGGVDFTSESNASSRGRFSYLENMYRDYEGDGGVMLESVPGFRKITRADNSGRVYSIFSYKDYLSCEQIVVHAGDKLYKFPLEERDRLYSLEPIASVEPQKSSAFRFGNSLYVIDGSDIKVIDGEGIVSSVIEDPSLPYTPTCYVNGEEYEQRNLLTNGFYERYRLGNCDVMARASRELEYEIISEEEKTCAVKGATFTRWIPIYIPSHTTIGESDYKVIEILGGAFNNAEELTAVTIANGVKKIGKNAFRNCINLKSVVLPESIELIEKGAFCSCNTLASLNLGKSLKKIGAEVILRCPMLLNIEYSGTEEEFRAIESETSFDITVNYDTPNDSVCVSVPVFSPASEISSVEIDGKEHEFSTVREGGLVTEIAIFDEDKSRINGKEVVILGTMSDTVFKNNSYGPGFMAEYSILGTDAILGCRLSESFDGRIFLSGNPALPNTVFYSQRDKTGRNNPLYFGILNYFNDGVGTHAVTSLLATNDSIAVFKDGDDAGGSIYYHTPQETDIEILPKIYPVSHIHNGISAVGETVSFFDEPIFISKLGVVSVSQSSYTGKRRIEVRSHNVNSKLLCESLQDVRLASWLGYLVVGCGEHIYLADSRQRFRHACGDYEYEWYFINGIATYSGENNIYRYSESSSDGYEVHTDTDEIASGTIGSYYKSGVGWCYYSEQDGKRYAVYKCDECVGGVKHPMTALYSHGEELLIFGTDNGDICIFNNDKRGVPPERLAGRLGFDREEYEKSFGRRIHSDFYSFNNRAVRYVARTVMDNMDVPHLTKSTVKNSLTAKLRLYSKTDVSFEIKTDRSDYSEVAKIPDTIPDFEDLDFSAFSFVSSDYSTVAVKEKEKGWIEKQLQVSSDKFNSPFGLCSQAYRYTVKGRIKNT